MSLNGADSKTEIMKPGVTWGFGLRSFAIPYLLKLSSHRHLVQSTYHFADDTNLLCVSNAPKKVQRQLNIDLKLLCNTEFRILVTLLCNHVAKITCSRI